jgi:hypothetical protein
MDKTGKLQPIPEQFATDREWLIPVSMVVALEMLLWTAAYIHGTAYAPLFTTYGLDAVAFFSVVVGVRLFGILIRLQREGEDRPIEAVLKIAVANRLRIVSALIGLQLMSFGSAAFAALKGGIPKLVPFWTDVPLANAEEAIFGAAPWKLSHEAFGWATPLFDHLYATFVPIHVLAVFALLASPPSRLKSMALVTLALCWIVLGVLGAYMLSSAGPLFYDHIFGGNRFAELVQSMRSSAPLSQIEFNALWSAFKSDHAFIANGISAMPSMHVALTLWLALVLNHTRVALIGWIYYGLIWLASVHLGWHYFSDGLVATGGTLFLWRFSLVILKFTRVRDSVASPVRAFV